MSDSAIRRAAILWLGGLCLCAASAVLAAGILSEAEGGAVYALVPSPSLADWLGSAVLWCVLAMAAGATVFGRFLAGIGCVLRGAAFGTAWALYAEGRLILPRPSVLIPLAGIGSALWLAETAAVLVSSDALFKAYAAGDADGFRSALRTGCGSAMTVSGCVLLASCLARMAMG
ncbi:MAG: hypothetical protein E7576_12420 [Ruminococcaceae bacterium]|jgi:hypothetical protein|nr:hypothetical protein [Oscillospiraceae bacterium]